MTLRMMLGNIGVTVIPEQLAVSAAHEAFDDKGLLKDEKQVRMLANVVESFVQTTKSLKK